MEGQGQGQEVKKSLKELRSELKNHRSSSMMPVSKLSRASVLAELGKYADTTPSGRETNKSSSSSKETTKVLEPVKSIKKSKAVIVSESESEHEPEPKVTNKKVKQTNSKVKVEKVEVKPVHKVKEITKEVKVEVKEKPKKPLTQYSKLWGEARKNGMSPKDASEWAKSKLK